MILVTTHTVTKEIFFILNLKQTLEHSNKTWIHCNKDQINIEYTS